MVAGSLGENPSKQRSGEGFWPNVGGTTLLGPSSKTIENSVLGSIFGKRVGGYSRPPSKVPPTRLAKNLHQNTVSTGFRRGSETGGVPFTPSSKTIRNSVLGSISAQTWGGVLYLGVAWSREQPENPQLGFRVISSGSASLAVRP